jgi:hypothetical protein
MTKTTEALRAKAALLEAEAAQLEAEAHLAERMEDADTIPTCPECGGREFEISAHGTVTERTISFEDDPAGDWLDDGADRPDHGEYTVLAECVNCSADEGVIRKMLEGHGWAFYGDPVRLPRLDGYRVKGVSAVLPAQLREWAKILHEHSTKPGVVTGIVAGLQDVAGDLEREATS